MNHRKLFTSIGVGLLGLALLLLIGCPASTTNPTAPAGSGDIIGTWRSVARTQHSATGTYKVEATTDSTYLTVQANNHWWYDRPTNNQGDTYAHIAGHYVYSAPLLKVYIDTVLNTTENQVGDSIHFVVAVDAVTMVFDSSYGGNDHQYEAFIRTGLSAATICGVAFDVDSLGLSNAHVVATSGAVNNTATTNNWGFFDITNITSGSWAVIGSTSSLASLPVGVVASGSGIYTVGLSVTHNNVTTGTIRGVVRNVNTQAAIANATVTTDSGGPSTTTNSNGAYTITGAVSRLTYLTATATGYRSSTVVRYINQGDTITQDINLAPTAAANGIIYGDVTNALNGTFLAGATITSSTGESATTNASGHFSFSVPAGSRALVASKTGYLNSPITVLRVTSAPDSVQQSFSLTPNLTGTTGQMRFVLTWGLYPRDLDSHLGTPNGEVAYYSHGDSLNAPWAWLDIDDVTSYGPETITVYSWHTGTYKYFVHNYSGQSGFDSALTVSQAVVNIYNSTGLVHQISVPTTGTGIYWYVCDIDGTTGTITYVNQLQTTDPWSSSKGPLRYAPKSSLKH